MESRPGQRGTCEAVGAKGAADAKQYGAEFGGKFADDGRGLCDVFWPILRGRKGRATKSKNTLPNDWPQVRGSTTSSVGGWGGGFKRMRGRSICGSGATTRRVEEYPDGASTERVGDCSIYQRRHRNAHLRARGDNCDWKGTTCVLVDLRGKVLQNGAIWGCTGVEGRPSGVSPLLRESSPSAW